MQINKILSLPRKMILPAVAATALTVGSIGLTSCSNNYEEKQYSENPYQKEWVNQLNVSVDSLRDKNNNGLISLDLYNKQVADLVNNKKIDKDVIKKSLKKDEFARTQAEENQSGNGWRTFFTVLGAIGAVYLGLQGIGYNWDYDNSKKKNMLYVIATLLTIAGMSTCTHKVNENNIVNEHVEVVKNDIEAQRSEIAQNLNNELEILYNAETFDAIKSLKNIDKNVLAELSQQCGLKNISYSENGETCHFFFEKDSISYDMKFKKLDNHSFVGTMDKTCKNGESELYIFKAEHIETNNANKFKLSKMRVVQNGVEENSPIEKKNLNEIRETGTEVSSKSAQAALKKDNRFYAGEYQGDLNSTTIKTIDKLITESVGEGKIVSLFSVDKK